jgi:NADPH-dependent 2,4-dienoyl-CoA reductase/sulfur reductase-like enzyme/nitrite reductase/ring-hydroxylating ferredoxin subunit
MAESEAPSGPDLATEGVELTELAGGALVAGTYEGTGVVLVQHDGTVYALEGSCSHYGGPLHEGLFDGACIRCPWHHARFDVATGQPIAPAYRPLQRFVAQVRDGRVFVTGKEESVLEPPAIEAVPESVVIVGGGAAGFMAAETLRNEGYTGPVTILSADEFQPYDRPNLSKDYLAGTAEDDWLPLQEPDHYTERNITLRNGARVVSIDAGARAAVLESGERVEYGALLLATGAAPRLLPIPGIDLPHVFTLRDRADSDRIIAALGDGARAVVIGASFIGMEVAASLRARGVDVTVVAPEEEPLSIILGPEVGSHIRSLHAQHGVQFQLGKKPAAIRESDVLLDDGTEIAATIVVVGTGVAPRLELAATAGLEVADNGLVVNEHLETSVPGIWAAGDIAAWPDRWSGERIRVEHWVVAERQGRVAALNMLGRQTPYTEVPFFWSQHYDVTLAYVGHAKGWDRAEVRGNLADNDALVAYMTGDKVAAVASIFRDQESLSAEVAMERGDEAALKALLD